jgi:hypothetical protein
MHTQTNTLDLSHITPPPGGGVWIHEIGIGPKQTIQRQALVICHETPGYVFVTVVEGNCDGSDGGIASGDIKGVRMDIALQKLAEQLAEWNGCDCFRFEDCDYEWLKPPWAYNKLLYTSREAYQQHVLGLPAKQKQRAKRKPKAKAVASI